MVELAYKQFFDLTRKKNTEKAPAVVFPDSYSAIASLGFRLFSLSTCVLFFFYKHGRPVPFLFSGSNKLDSYPIHASTDALPFAIQTLEGPVQKRS